MCTMKIIDKKDIPPLLTPDEQKRFNDYHDKVLNMMKEQQKPKDEINTSFGDFWNLCDNPIPILYTKFIKGKPITYLTRNKEQIKVVISMTKEPTMNFVDAGTIPKKHGGKTGLDWAKYLNQIPVGKAWIVAEDDKDFKISSVKSAVKVINKTAKKTLYNAVQRTEDGKIKLYVTKA